MGYNDGCPVLPFNPIGPIGQNSGKGGVNMAAEVGQPAPDFNLFSDKGERVRLSQYKGEKHVVLSFHVFDFTGG